MQYTVLIFCFLIILYLVILLQKKETQIRNARKQIEELQSQTDQVKNAENVSEAIWNHTNIIHLYASLTMEESSAASVKEKQSEIIRSAEEILSMIQK